MLDDSGVPPLFTSLIQYFNGDNLVLINKSTTSADGKADLIINDDIAKVLSEAVDNLK